MPGKRSAPMTSVVPIEHVARKIYLIRGQKVMLDADLAALYNVPTKALNQAVKRNLDRFPDDFMFRLTKEEIGLLNRSQFVTGSQKHRNPRLLPYVFTEHGVAMLSSVLNSARAVQMNILIIHAFVAMRELLATNKDFAARIEKLETSQQQHASVISLLADEIDKLKEPPPVPPRRRIGFTSSDEDEG